MAVLEDFIVSSNLLPLGSLGYLLFCTWKNGWGWKGFLEEANTGSGFKLPQSLRWYMTYVIPAVIIFIYLKGYYDMFAGKSATVFYSMFALAFFILAFIFHAAWPRQAKK